MSTIEMDHLFLNQSSTTFNKNVIGEIVFLQTDKLKNSITTTNHIHSVFQIPKSVIKVGLLHTTRVFYSQKKTK
jgi:hypothetical protein